ncbi:Mannosylglucosyl-3-phosphoglycerate phosphatase [bioreactor metagenome]|uniref:Mannosylglucosyl-3-phosphoglycerate phosphatase n=1 Tax=bioreactor metagenome TaxID=1076179 RepID=A0A644U8J0_9ZZZZ|nr:5'-nucleotidase C-terminal domain-containing protein [Negativicutes bacterium]
MKKVASRIKLFASLMMVLVLTAATAVVGAAGGNQQVQISVLAVNDFHGALLEEGKNPGMIKLGTYLKEEKALNAEGTIILSAGDMFQGSAQSNLLYGKPVVDAMNSIGFNAMALGNHEFDWGIATLEQQAKSSRFPYLAANITDKTTGGQVPFLKPYTIIKKNGVNIAIIGLTTPETAYKSNPLIVSQFRFSDPAEVVNELVPKLKSQGAQIIIVLAHLGCEVNEQGAVTGEAADFAKQVTGVDLIITGHSHSQVLGRVNGIPVVQAGSNGRVVAKATFLYSLSENKIISSIIGKNGDINPKQPYDQQMTRIVNRTNQELGTVMNKPIGSVERKLTHDRYELSLFGQWATDTMRQATKADIAFINGGGIRESLPAGKVTLGHIYQALPFDNTLYITQLTGRQIIDALEYGFENGSVGVLQYSGIKVRYNKTNPIGQRLVKVTTPDGADLNPDKIYKVVINDFLAAGGDGFVMLSQGHAGYDTTRLLRDVIVTNIKRKHVNFTGDNRLIYETVLIVKAAS